MYEKMEESTYLWVDFLNLLVYDGEEIILSFIYYVIFVVDIEPDICFLFVLGSW